MRTTFEMKLATIYNAIVKQMQEEGHSIEDTNGMKDDIMKVAKGYMLSVQCMWYRITDDKKVANLLSKFEEETKVAMVLLEQYDFESLVYTFRKVYTNLFEVTSGVGRKYNLSKKDYNSFLKKVTNGTLEVQAKPIKVAKAKTTKKATTTTKVVESKSKFMSSLVGVEKQITIKLKSNKDQLVGKIKPQATSVKEPSTKVGWIEHPIQEYLESETFVKVILKDESKLFVKFIEYDETTKVVTFKHKELGDVEVNIVDITKVFTYVKTGVKRTKKSQRKASK